MTPTRGGLIPREQAERLILATPPAELLRMAAVASGPMHHGRADLDLRTGEVVMGHAPSAGPGEGREPDMPGRVALWRVAAGEVEFFEEDPDEGTDVDDLEMLAAEMHALRHPPDRSAADVLAGARAALARAYSTAAEGGGT